METTAPWLLRRSHTEEWCHVIPSPGRRVEVGSAEDGERRGCCWQVKTMSEGKVTHQLDDGLIKRVEPGITLGTFFAASGR